MEEPTDAWPNEGMTEHTTPQSEAPEAPQAPEADTHEAPYRRRLERREEGKWIAGVATGLADYFAIPVWLVRILFLFLLPAGGTAIFLYLALVVFMPTEYEDESLAERWFGSFNMDSNRERTIGIGLAAVAAIVLLASATSLDGGVIVALALLAVGVLLYQGSSRSDQPPQAAVSEGSTIVEDDATETDDMGTPPRPPAPPTARRAREPREPRPPKQPKPKQPKSNLFAYTFAAILFATAGLATLDITGVLFPDAFHYVALAVAITGAGLVIGAWRGRSRGLFFLGLALLPFLSITWVTGNVDQIIDTLEADGDVHRNEIVVVDDINGLERLDFGVGEVTVDLTEADFVGDAELRVTMDAGQLTVVVPDDVRVRADVDLGAINRPGTDAEGIDVTTTYGPSLDDADAYVRVSLDVGEIVIEEGN